MQTITKITLLMAFLLNVAHFHAQSLEEGSIRERIESLEKLKETIKEEEKALLKEEVEAINRRLDNGEITQEQASELKKEVAEKRALNIENRIAIIDNKILLLQRNNEQDYLIEDQDEDSFVVRIGKNSFSDRSFYFGRRKHKPRKYDRRTTSDLVLAFGLNNAIIDGQDLDDSPYKFGGSRFFEIGWAWKTRVFKESNWLRLKYGYSFQINGLKPTNNRYFVTEGDQTYLEEFEYDLKKSKLSITNLVFPVHFEFGPSKRIDKDTYFRYSTRNQFKFGLGGYAGFNIGTRQKLKYKVDGERVKDKIKKSYNTTNLVYGLSGYMAFDDTAIYVKYDLSPLFKDQSIEQRNISLGVRFDMD